MPEDVSKIWVGGLARDVQPEELREVFRKFGELRSSDDAVLVKSGKGDTFAFISFVSERAVGEAVRALDNSTEFGQPIKVKVYKDRRGERNAPKDDDRLHGGWQGKGHRPRDWSCSRSRSRACSHERWDRGGKASGKGDVDPDCRVWVGGLPKDISEREVEKEFARHGHIENVKICQNDRDTFAFVQFQQPRDAASAVKHLDQSNVFGRVMKVGPATRSSGKGKGKGAGYAQDRDDRGSRPRDNERAHRRSRERDNGKGGDYRRHSRSRDAGRGGDERGRGERDGRDKRERDRDELDRDGRDRDAGRRESDRPRARFDGGRSVAEDDRAPLRRLGRPRSFKVAVSCLPTDMTRDELKHVTADCGRILALDLWEERDCNAGLIEFESHADADKAIKELDGRKVVDWNMKLSASARYQD